MVLDEKCVVGMGVGESVTGESRLMVIGTLLASSLVNISSGPGFELRGILRVLGQGVELSTVSPDANTVAAAFSSLMIVVNSGIGEGGDDGARAINKGKLPDGMVVVAGPSRTRSCSNGCQVTRCS